MQPESVDDVLTLIVEFGKNSKIEIKVPEKFSRQLTCEWLLDEAIAKINEKSTIKTIQENEKSLVALKTKNKDFAVDYLLSDPKRSLQFLKDGTILEPYYGIDARPLDEFQFKVELEDFEIETMLGHGAFSTVYLARKKSTGKLYALKQVKKGELTKRKRNMLYRERNALIEIISPFVVQLKWTFQTSNYCYFVLDFVPYGSLRQLLGTRKCLKEDEARFVIVEAIMGLNAIHANNFLYRDLKPENVLLGADGHIQLADFGLVKKVSNIHDLNYSQCGTLEIIAPEIIKEEGYNCLVDYYNIGTLAFELVTGRLPRFKTVDRTFADQRILEEYKISAEMQDFICRLLTTNPASRLGAKKGLNEICSHSWLSDVNMIDVSKKKLRSPFKTDPYAIKFNTHKFNFAIDEGCNYLFDSNVINEWSNGRFADRNLANFSFYGFGDETSDLYVFSKNPPSFTKAPVRSNISSALFPYSCSNTQRPSHAMDSNHLGAKVLVCKKDENSIREMNDETTDEVSDSNDVVASKLERYNQLEAGTPKSNGVSRWSTHSKSPIFLDTSP